MTETENLPEFENPPVSEVALGIMFEPVAQWSIPYFGLYWGSIRDEYPLARQQAPIIPQVEVFGDQRLRGNNEFEISEVPDARCWFLTEDETRLIQVQKDRFLVNWRKVKGAELYPRYNPDIRPKFSGELQRFSDFLTKNGLDALKVIQCEITYVNEVERGKLWTTFADINKIIQPWSGATTDHFLPSPETLQIKAAYNMPEDRGRLHVAVQHAFRRRDSQEMLQITLTSRGRPEGSGIDQILAWFDQGREWIVRGFVDFTAEPAHLHWRRKK